MLILSENDPLRNNIPGNDEFFSIPGGVTDQYRRVFQDLNVSGKAGDVYSFGSWLYGQSVPTDRERTGNLYPCFEIKIHYYDTSGVWKDAVVVKANPDCIGQWQFVSTEAIIPVDYSKLSSKSVITITQTVFRLQSRFATVSSSVRAILTATQAGATCSQK